jgi:3'(2'), 5'-bisphosphate nucleotidase
MACRAAVVTSPLLETLIGAALAAGEEIEAIYAGNFASEMKLDGSPVTEADHRAEAIILAALGAAFPDIPVVAEEEACAGRIPELARRFFLVDPLDGTRSFVNRDGEFTVNIGLIDGGEPIAGVVYAPDKAALYFGAKGEGAFRRLGRGDAPAEPIAPATRTAGSLRGIGSRNHAAPGQAEKMAALGVTDFVPAGSSLKFCLVADGSADVYPRWGRTMEWDTAAGQAVLEAAGGRVQALEGDREAGPLRYGKLDQGFENPHFIAWGT